MVDPQRSEARVYRRSGERLQQVAELTAADRDLLASPFFPGLEIPLFEIFL